MNYLKSSDAFIMMDP